MPTPGKVINTEGRTLGEHKGLSHYTIGQRYAPVISPGDRLYVLKINSDSNQIVVGREEELYSQKLMAKGINWVSGKAPTVPTTVNARIRYKSAEVVADIFPDKDSVGVVFSEPQRAITPGQAIVFYRGEEVLGGGTIEEPDITAGQRQIHASSAKF
jgi:tRNA-specific 2-thiouridylase